MTGAPSTPFAADSLAANQGGQLTDAQRQAYRSQDRGFRKNELIGAVMAIIVGLILITEGGPNPNAWLRPIAALAAFLIAGGLIFRATIGGDSLARDLARGSVVTVEGAVLRSTRQGKNMEWHYLDVAGKSFEVPRSAHNASPEAAYVR